ncbi:paired box protein Pax-6-like [Saccostrea echinata]|uniref:paired box protein Pax-6-like n=1 Tax=Saccostrea echinata TaxID=191078 RepID=UPI002A80B137|nr:paired box protein Pax-6-like [Saccostrea echinata]
MDRFPPHKVLILESSFRQSPYPSDQEIQSLAQRLKEKTKRIKTWFSNRRTKAKRILAKIRNQSEKRVHFKCVRGKYIWKACSSNTVIHPSNTSALITHSSSFDMCLSTSDVIVSNQSSTPLEIAPPNHITSSGQRITRTKRPRSCFTCESENNIAADRKERYARGRRYDGYDRKTLQERMENPQYDGYGRKTLQERMENPQYTTGMIG